MPATFSRLYSPPWALICGLFLFLFGLAMVVLWHAHGAALLEVHPGLLTMKHNTALAFTFLGAGLWGLHFGKLNLSRFASVIVLIIGVVTLFQYAMGIDLGLDEWLVKDRHNVTQFPGRMSPVTAMAFILSGLALLAVSRDRRRYFTALMLGSVIAAAGLVSALNYLGAQTTGISWWQQIGFGVAIHTAIAMTFTGITFIGISWPHWNQKNCVYCLPLMLFVSMLTLTFLLWQEIVAAEFRPQLSPTASMVFPTVVLVIGLLLSTLLGIAGYLAQTARARAADLTRANQDLTKEIAERVLTQKNLSEARQELQDFMETAPIGLYWLNKEGVVLWANRAEYRLLGYTRDEYIGQPFSKFYVNANYAHGLLERMNEGDALDRVEALLVAKNGDTKRILITSEPFYKNGSLVHTRCFSLDVTEQKLAEHALRQNMERFRLSLDNSLDAFVVMDDEGRVIEWSAQAEHIFGWSRDEVLNKPMAQAIIPERFRAAHFEGMKRFIRTGLGPLVNKHIELIGLKRNQEEFPIELSIVPIKWEDSYIFSSFIHDITERKQAQRDLEIYMQKLVQSNRELQQFASVSSHDLQEPLRKIRAFAERLTASHKAELSPQAQDYLNRMQNAAARMQNLINDLLTYSRLTSRARPFVKVNLGELLSEVLSDLEIRIDNTQAKIDVGILPTVVADKVQMQQLFQNLLTNALKFHKPGQPPEIKISSRYLDDASNPVDAPVPYGYAEITVRDSGIGFDMKYADQIFNTFQRLHTRQEYEGTGIGLAICRKIAAHHNGSIIVKSQAGIGSEFIVKLPLDPIKGKTNAS